MKYRVLPKMKVIFDHETFKEGDVCSPSNGELLVSLGYLERIVEESTPETKEPVAKESTPETMDEVETVTETVKGKKKK